MNANFLCALSCTLKEEGGWSDESHDPGHATMKGITLATFREYHPGASKDDLRHISDADVQRIYHDGYWKPVRADDLPNGVDLAAFDFAVNSGRSRAAKYLQRIAGVIPDGVIGPITLAAVNAMDAKTAVNLLCDRRLEFLKGLPTWKFFGKGWSSRVSRIREAALDLVSLT